MPREDLKLLKAERTVSDDLPPPVETPVDAEVGDRVLRLLVSSDDGVFPDDAA
jgi:hypothetical protein